MLMVQLAGQCLLAGLPGFRRSCREGSCQGDQLVEGGGWSVVHTTAKTPVEVKDGDT